MILFIKLMMGHALADFALQSDPMAKGKNRNRPPDLNMYRLSWTYWLTAHSLIHGMVVWLITGSIYLGMAESLAHWIIDFGKCDAWYGIHVDQGLHVFCKILWVMIV